MKRTKARTLPPDEQVSFLFSVMAKLFDRAFASIHTKLALSVGNLKIMRTIAFFGPLSASQLGAKVCLDPDKITRAVDALVDRGFVSRKHDETDRRKVVLTLSAKGRRAHEKIEAAAGKLEVELLSVLSADEQRALLASLRKLEQYSLAVMRRREGGRERRPVAQPAARIAKLAAPLPKRATANVRKQKQTA
ncbi:MarR family winged helix-turn-helix transcriptional regulator [Pseudorhodoplanes sp.]|uniref:MarR family winged helix-turn-helix transcriptional regulator n=1 Tax=Pseudorhodoplanes sp. TaxID=1934341 RepID=UPI00391B5AB1